MTKSRIYRSNISDSFEAGVKIIEDFINDFQSPVSFIYLLVTPDHDTSKVLEGIYSLIPSGIPLFGTKADGIALSDGLHQSSYVAIMCFYSSNIKFYMKSEQLSKTNDLETCVEDFTVEIANQILDCKAKRENTLLLLFNDNRVNNDVVSKKVFEVLNPLCKILGGVVHGYEFDGPIVNNQIIDESILGCLIILDKKCAVGVSHGWFSTGKYVVANKVEDNRIIEMNGRNAFEVYKEIWKNLKTDIGDIAFKDDFYKFSVYHPLALTQVEGEYLIRDPYDVNDNGEILCGGYIPGNSILHFMEGTQESLLTAPETAISRLNKNNDSSICLFFDCFTRIYLPGFDINNEIESISNKIGIKCEIFGMMCRGEFATTPLSSNLFHNKSLGVTVL